MKVRSFDAKTHMFSNLINRLHAVSIRDICIFLCVAVSGWVLPACVFLRGRPLDVLFSSDLLLPASLNWNMAHRAHGWLSFQQPRVLGLFPDQVVYHLLAWLCADTRLTALTYAAVSFTAFLILGGLCVRRLSGQTFSASLVVLAVVFDSVALAAHLSGARYIAYNLVLFPVTHSGGFLLALLLFLTIKPENSRPGPWPIALGLLGCLNDPLFLFYAVLPRLAGIAIQVKPLSIKSLDAKLSPWLRLLLAALVGYNLPRLLFSQKTYNQTFADWMGNMHLLGHDLMQINPDTTGLAIGLGFMIWLCSRLRRPPAGWTRPDQVFVLASMTLPLFIFLYFYHDETCVRYLLPLYLWPLIGVSALVTQKWPAGWTLAAALLLLVASLGLQIATRQPPALVWQPRQALCLSAAKKTYPLEAGLAAYDIARPLEVLSQFSLQLAPLTIDGRAYLWGNDPYWFLHDTHADKPAPYNYILTDRLDEKALLRVYGVPNHVYTCLTTSVWIYDRPGYMLSRLRSVSKEALQEIRN